MIEPCPEARRLIDHFRLQPHPEGGHYREFFRSARTVTGPNGPRSALTAIYYLLCAGEVSRWHAVAADEQWTFLHGDPLELSIQSAEDPPAVVRLGPIASGCEAVAVVPADAWQSARSTGQFTLVGCTVAPGFSFDDLRFR